MEIAWWMWGVFLGIVSVMLVLDLGVLHRKERAISIKESLLLSGAYIMVSLLFGVWVWAELGADRGREYFTGYIVEKTLAMDNLFIISLLFSHFAIPRQYQHRVLFWGVLGVIILRGLMIGGGALLVSRFSLVLEFFAAFLVVTGVKMLYVADKPMDISKGKLLRFLRKHLRITPELHGKAFSVMQPDAKNPARNVRYYTPLFVVLVLIEIADIIFAVDSIPAIFAITDNPYVIYTSNIFAVLGLRALYFALNEMLKRFHYLKPTLGLVLIFIGGKVFLEDLTEKPMPASISLSVTVLLLAGGVVYSLMKTRGDKHKE